MFCSELVAAALQRVGVLGAQPLAANYTPKDFAGHALPLPPRVALADVVELRADAARYTARPPTSFVSPLASPRRPLDASLRRASADDDDQR